MWRRDSVGNARNLDVESTDGNVCGLRLIRYERKKGERGRIIFPVKKLRRPRGKYMECIYLRRSKQYAFADATSSVAARDETVVTFLDSCLYCLTRPPTILNAPVSVARNIELQEAFNTTSDHMAPRI